MNTSALPFSPAQSRAPARLDVMGGISDYSGGLCLEWPLAIATTCRITPHGKPVICARTETIATPATSKRENQSVEISLAELEQLGAPDARARFQNESRWALYVIGAFIVLYREIDWTPMCGMNIEIESDVPRGAGVSSSAALEVAVLTAINRAFRLELDGHQIACLAQQVENEIVGAPCGIMDQLTVSLGRADHLLQLKCQPDLIEDFVAPPADIEFWGIDSGVKHSVGGAAYARARCAAMMGRALLARLAPKAMCGSDGELYLANISTDVWRALRLQIPEQLSGADFLREHEHLDSATTVDAATIYPVRLATEHPIYEADRTARFARLMREMGENPAARMTLGRAAGELMIQSHFSYDHRCDLGSKETDLLVELARAQGAKNGIYGAKITGGGAGGTVAILGDHQINADLDATIEQIAADYGAQSGRTPQVFRGSSDGANVLFQTG